MLELIATCALEYVRDAAVLGPGSGRAATGFVRALEDEVTMREVDQAAAAKLGGKK